MIKFYTLTALFFLLGLFCQAQSEYLVDSTYSSELLEMTPVQKVYYEYDELERLIKLSNEYGFTLYTYPSDNRIEILDYVNSDPSEYIRKTIQTLDDEGRVNFTQIFENVGGIDELTDQDTVLYNDIGIAWYSRAYDMIAGNLVLRRATSYYYNDELRDSAKFYNYDTDGVLFAGVDVKYFYNSEDLSNLIVVDRIIFGDITIDSTFITYDSENRRETRLIKTYDENYVLEECGLNSYEYQDDHRSVTTSISSDCQIYEDDQLEEFYDSDVDIFPYDSVLTYRFIDQEFVLRFRTVSTFDDSDPLKAIENNWFEVYQTGELDRRDYDQRFYHKNTIISIVETPLEYFESYPNPAAIGSKLTIRSEKAFDAYSLYNADGNKVSEVNIDVTREINIEAPKIDGMYYIQLSSRGSVLPGFGKVLIIE